MSSNTVCNHTRDEQIGLPLRGRPILLSLVWLQTELDSTQSYNHYLYNNQINVRALIGQSAVGYCVGKLMEKSRFFWIII